MEGQRSWQFIILSLSLLLILMARKIYFLLQSFQWFHYFQYCGASSGHHQSWDCSVIQVENTLSIDLAHKLPHLVNFEIDQEKENSWLFNLKTIWGVMSVTFLFQAL